MSNVISKINLQSGLQRSKTYTDTKTLEVINTLISDLEGLADLAGVLYVDNDGDVCQYDEQEAEEEEVENG
ncbi:MAG: hypothetical protein IJQ56_08140 [Synergistaceae bacterium]|nr:hypothetical protein [Synergistaceae bacterium]